MKDVHKHEKAMHPGKPLTKLAKGGSSCGTKGYAKGGVTSKQRMERGRNMAKFMNQGGK